MKFKCRECNEQFTGKETLEHCPMCYELCEAISNSSGSGSRAAKEPKQPKLGESDTKASPPLAPKVRQKPVPKIVRPRAVTSQVSKPVVSNVKIASPPPTAIQPYSNFISPQGNQAVAVPRPAIRQKCLSGPNEHASKKRRIDAPLPLVAPTPRLAEAPKAASLPPFPESSVWSQITPSSLVLFIGEGNFSFAYAVAKRLGSGKSLIATDIEMHHELLDMVTRAPGAIPDSGGSFGRLIELGATVSCAVDVTTLSTTVPTCLYVGSLDFMSWAFPHTRTPNRDENCVSEHRTLLRAFIDEAAKMLKLGGTALITVKEGYPYNSWDVAGLRTDYVDYSACEPFFPKDFPEYAHVTTIGAPITVITPATTHIFKKIKEP